MAAASVAAATPRSVRSWIFSVWFDHQLLAVNIGSGKINHPGRYLVLLPPINGATEASGTAYFMENPGDPFKAWDRYERSAICPANVLPFVAVQLSRRKRAVLRNPGGVTPPGGKQGAP